MQLLFLFVSVKLYARFFKHTAIKDYWIYYSRIQDYYSEEHWMLIFACVQG